MFHSEVHECITVRCRYVSQWGACIFYSEVHYFFTVRCMYVSQWGAGIFHSEVQVYFTVWCVLIFHSEVHAQIEHFSERYTRIFHCEVHVLLSFNIEVHVLYTFRSEVHVLYRSCTRMLFACALYPYVVCFVHFKFVNTADDCTCIVYYCIHTVQYCMQDGGGGRWSKISTKTQFFR